MKKLVLAASIASMLSGAAFAATDLDAGTGSGGTYATEIVISGATVLNDGAAADQTATVAFGATLATDFVAYVRFDLSSGTFDAAPSFAVDDSAGAPALVNVAQGGAGESFVIFAVAPSAAGENLVNTEVGTFIANGVEVGNKDAVTLQYKLYETLTNAANETLPLKTRSASYLSFANAIAITAGTTQTQTADVAATGGAYRRFVSSSLEEPVLSFTVTHTSRALLTGAASVVGDILADTNSVTLAGDFTARGAVTLDIDSNCGNAGTATSSVSNTAAGFTGLSAAAIVSAQWYACYTVSGSAAIPVAAYTGSINLEGQSGFQPTDGDTGTGNIERNGTILKAAFAEASTVTGTASAVSLTNTSSIPAPFTVRCLTSGSPVVGTPGSVPANSTGRYSIVGGLGCPTSVRGLELTFAVPTQTVIGSVVRQNLTTGVASFDGMVGNE